MVILGNLVTADISHPLLTYLEEIFTVKKNLPSYDDTRRIWYKAQHRHGADALTAGTFADKTDTLSPAYMVRELIHRLDDTFVGIEIRTETVHFQYHIVVHALSLHLVLALDIQRVA